MCSDNGRSAGGWSIFPWGTKQPTGNTSFTTGFGPQIKSPLDIGSYY